MQPTELALKPAVMNNDAQGTYDTIIMSQVYLS